MCAVYVSYLGKAMKQTSGVGYTLGQDIGALTHSR